MVGEAVVSLGVGGVIARRHGPGAIYIAVLSTLRDEEKDQGQTHLSPIDTGNVQVSFAITQVVVKHPANGPTMSLDTETAEVFKDFMSTLNDAEVGDWINTVSLTVTLTPISEATSTLLRESKPPA